MKIRVNELREGFNSYRVESKGQIGDPPDFADLSGDLIIEKCGTTLRVKGSLNFTALQECSRCLNDFECAVSQPVELFYRTGKLEDALIGKEAELKSDDLNVIAYKGNELDIWPDIREAMMLALPMKPLCSDDCRGICSGCGQDLNSGKCKCRKESMDPRWEGLLKLTEKKPARKKK
ncbi:MAG: DUF177 domain-containing protein [Candidatus Edwardsbacteria bacterium]|nr:DUF177 domain-containing protein [Candidatus Edwardsbacteria bacterium]MBU1576387.1 DUF177 domain-containing protein [Candidatus Edwardsbacteria bacterium]MBU2463848.1 DUF177 domain-containing protein [Candidatus Edwardsbacteria bacterium]MBU2593564.1 DUF177 domain-containing protein [Candidatus Edwardsbacteria bacterium]